MVHGAKEGSRKTLNVGSRVPESLGGSYWFWLCFASPMNTGLRSWSPGGSCHQPPWGLALNSRAMSFHLPALPPARGACLPDRQQRSFAARLCLVCRWLFLWQRKDDYITSGVVHYFGVFLMLVLWVTKLISWLLDSETYWCDGPLPLSVSEYFWALNSWWFWLN